MKVKVGLIQMRMSDDVWQNLEKALSMLDEAASRGARVACLPELFTTKYFPQTRGVATSGLEISPEIVLRRISELAGRLGMVVVAGSIIEREGEALYNTSFVINSDGAVLGRYRKTHLPDDECFWEEHYFAPGNLGYPVFNTSVGKIGVLICFDQWFPEPARILALRGAELILYPSAIGTVAGVSQEEGDWAEAWEAVQRGHAIANSVPVAVVNRVGVEGRIEFWGRSLLIDAFGRVLLRAKPVEGVFVGEVDLGLGKRIREGWGFMVRRRPGLYGDISERVS
ncbi:MAG: nitrilase-related carbon-nitrogen hydrolase [Nitrososphaerota archaeon]